MGKLCRYYVEKSRYTRLEIIKKISQRQRFCYTLESSMNEWKSVPRLISGRSGATATVKSKTGVMVVTGGFGFYNFVLNSSEILEKNKDLRKLKWTSG